MESDQAVSAALRLGDPNRSEAASRGGWTMAVVKRQCATELAELLLTTLDRCQREWSVSLVTEVYVFGSYARSATEPHDLDIDVEIGRDDDRYLQVTSPRVSV